MKVLAALSAALIALLAVVKVRASKGLSTVGGRLRDAKDSEAGIALQSLIIMGILAALAGAVAWTLTTSARDQTSQFGKANASLDQVTGNTTLCRIQNGKIVAVASKGAADKLIFEIKDDGGSVTHVCERP